MEDGCGGGGGACYGEIKGLISVGSVAANARANAIQTYV